MTELGVLQRLSESDRLELFGAARRRRYGRRETVFHEGDGGDSAFLIVSGCLAIRKTGPNGVPAIIAVRGAGDTVGELALVEPGGRRTATVIALEPTDTLILERDAFVELCRSRPSLGRFLTMVLAARIRRLDEQLAISLLSKVEDRIASRLVTLADLCRTDAGGSGGIALTQQDLASLTGTSRATVNRVLSQLAEDGAIEMRRGRIRVLDRDRMLAVPVSP